MSYSQLWESTEKWNLGDEELINESSNGIERELCRKFEIEARIHESSQIHAEANLKALNS